VSRQPFKLVLLVIVCLSINWLVTLECLIPMVACWHLVQREKHRLESARRLTEDRARSRMQLLAESLRKSRLVRGFSMEAFEHERFQIHLDRARKQFLSANHQHTWSRWLSRVFVVVCIVFVLMLVGSKTLQPDSPGYLSFAAALLLLGAFASLHRPLEDLWLLNWELDDATLAADRIYRYLDTTPQVGQVVGAKFLQPLMKVLKYEGVTYRLSEKHTLLEDFNAQVNAGEVTAFVSLDALEPRAAAYLLPRFIEPHAGRIVFDGEDIAWVTLESLRMETIYVGGADAFFTGTVLENLTCGNTRFSLQDATEAAKEAHAHAFILRLSQGYETVLGEHGERLDAGQAFRLGLARAILRDPALLIIEEPDARLDEDTKSLLDDAYNRVSRDRTVIFLPTRLSTVRRADRVILIHHGKVEAVGSHAKLLKVSPLYRHWEYLRFNEYKAEAPS
jgi:ABC-type multidrug transport system fused ATPase/permease subunit